MFATAFFVGALIPVGWLPIYTIVAMAMAPALITGRRGSCLLLTAVLGVWYAIGRFLWEDGDALRDTLLWGVFHVFALLSALETRAARQAHERIAELNRELVAARHLLEEASRASERERIARDLHDLLGHHLTALSIDLQVATHQATGPARETVQRCHALSRLLLSDVRESVSRIREDEGIDLRAALEGMAQSTPGLTVHLDLPDALDVEDVTTARTLLRCVQEALTNSLRHANAAHAWIRLRECGGALHLALHDDGRVPERVEPGNGLRGMRERVEDLNGEMRIGRHRQALALEVTLPAPLRESA
jgi:signal transduction histidine kinase